MKTVLNEADHREIVRRIESLTPQTKAVWGTMNVAQMLAHCVIGVQSAAGKVKVKRVFIGRLLGPLLRKGFLSAEPFKKNLPTAKEFLMTDTKEFDNEKAMLLMMLDEFYKAGEAGTTKDPHAFFGKMTGKQWGEMQWKHLDHHLRQFGV